MRFILAALLIFATPALAERPLHPPKKYDHPYPGPMEIWRVDGPDTYAWCQEQLDFTIPKDTAGCQYFSGDTCVVIVAAHSPRARYEDILRHEIAHCNGWEH